MINYRYLPLKQVTHHMTAQTLTEPVPEADFQYDPAQELIQRRNPNIGQLFTAERAPFYCTILYRLLLFKREHELEPLYEDIYEAVRPPLDELSAGEYLQDQFRGDIGQLEDWALLTSRMEKQRLRGYRDNRKRKFRYRLSRDAAAILHWLEERRLDDLEERSNDARDLLGEVRGTLGELLRLLHSLRPNAASQEDTARRIIFQLGKADETCQEITEGLIDLNGRLLAFLLLRYEAAEVKIILLELDRYVQVFLKQAFNIRREIMPLLDRLHKNSSRERLKAAFQIMEKERLKAPHLLRVRRQAAGLSIPAHLAHFFAENGGLDHLLQRINDSSLQVWQRLRSHLQELERKNHRLEDLRARIAEIAALPEEEPPLHFMENLLSYGHGLFDRNYWDNMEKAEPPQPVRRVSRRERVISSYIKGKKKSSGPVQSMDEARLAELAAWINARILTPPANGRLGINDFEDFDDFARTMEMAKAGILSDGKRLAKISLSLKTGKERLKLSCRDYLLDLPGVEVTRSE
jgi:hypothetical protein